ncbi:MAG: PhoX family protein [Chloroflexaceae bacterium]
MSNFDEQDLHVVRSTRGRGETFAEIMQRRISRRAFLRGTATVSTVLGVAACTPAPEEAAEVAPTEAPTDAPEPTEAPTEAPEPTAEATATPAEIVDSSLPFTAIQPRPNTDTEVAVPDGYQVAVLLRWGDPLFPDAPEFDPENQTPEAQAQQFGYNCDYVGFLPLPAGSTTADNGLLVVNHEYTNPELMFPGYLDISLPDEEPTPNVTQQIVDTEIESHGVTVVEISRNGNGWSYNRDSQYNRRLTGTSPIAISGPAADHEWLQTSADPTGQDIRGTLNNCAAGKTPWGTVVTAEENFHQYFANLGQLPDDDPRKEIHDRYGIPEESSSRLWEQFQPRFDVAQEPNEPFRFGWAVEIDPYDPNFTPVKRTWLGRFRHEAQTFAIAPDGRVVVYTGDDARFEYVYKYISNGTYNAEDRTANFGLLDDGMLYVAKFNDDGSGEWMPLEFGTGPLTEENGFTSQSDVLMKTRVAGDLLGATKMDRPEDIEPNPVNNKVYIALTNNTNRGVDDNPGTDEANPRPENAYGHVIELTEAGDDYAATSFDWEIFILCGDPEDDSTYFAGFSKDQVSPIANPDNVAFDTVGNLWIATDGQPRTLEFNDALFGVPVSGPERGYLKQFFSSVAGSEVCGPEFTPDDTTLFLAIQHPGEGGTYDVPITSWPEESGPPRPSVLAIWADSGGAIGQV